MMPKKNLRPPEGFSVERVDDEVLKLWFYGDVDDEWWTVYAVELAEAVARLEAPGYPTMPPEDLEDEPDNDPNYTTADVATLEPEEGLLVLRKIKTPGPDLLEFTTPAGSVYEFEYPRTVAYLRQFLPR